jgi:hypothetical protein
LTNKRAGSGTGLTGDYFTGQFDNFVASRLDATVNFNYGTGAPSGISDDFPTDDFTISWSGQVQALSTGNNVKEY